MHLFNAFRCHIKCQQSIHMRACVLFLTLSTALIGWACISESSVYFFFFRRKINENKQTPTVCAWIKNVACSVYDWAHIRFIYIIFTCSPFSGYPIQFFFSFFLFSNNESERRMNEIWKGCINGCACVCEYVRACLYSLCLVEIRCWKLKRIEDCFFHFIHSVRCVMVWLKIRNGHTK